MEYGDVRVVRVRRLSMARDDYHGPVSIVLKDPDRWLYVRGACAVSRSGCLCDSAQLRKGHTVMIVEIDTHFGGIAVVRWAVPVVFVCMRLSASEFRVRMVESWRWSERLGRTRFIATLFTLRSSTLQ